MEKGHEKFSWKTNSGNSKGKEQMCSANGIAEREKKNTQQKQR